MSKLLATGGIMLFGLLSAAAQEAGPCPMKQVKNGLYCEKDGKIVDAKEVKGGKHVGCESPVTKVRICAPVVFKCAGADGKDCGMVSPKPGKCKCKTAMKSSAEIPSVIKYQCTGCNASGINRAKIEHDKDQDKAAEKKGVKTVCGHGGATQ